MFTKMWSRRLILVASVLASITNVAIPFFIAQFIGLVYVAIWVSYKAGVQLTISLVPNCVNSLLYISKYSSVNRLDIIKKGCLTAGGVFFLQGFILVLVSIIVDELKPFLIPLLMYSAAFQFSGFQGIVVRGLKRSDILIRASAIDVLMSLGILIIVFLHSRFEIFILLSAGKEVLRGGYMIALYSDDLKRDGKRKASDKLISKYKYMHLSRGFLQVLSQLGDRVVYPVMFGLAASAQAALGASVGMIIALLSSSAFTWALPRTMEGYDMSRWLITEWLRLVLCVVVLASALFILMPMINSEISSLMINSIHLDNMFVAAFVFASISSINFMSFGLTKKRLTSKKYISTHLMIVFSSYSFMGLAFFVGFSSVISVYCGSFCSVIGILFVNRNIIKYGFSGVRARV